MFLYMIIGAGLAVWSVVGIAIIVAMIYAYRNKNGLLGSLIGMAFGWLCVTSVISLAMLA